MNNKGQALVLFILILPLLLIVLGMVVDLGMIGISKKKVDTVVQNILFHSFENREEKTDEDLMSEMDRLITINLGTVNRKIEIGEHIYITVEKKMEPLFPSLLKQKYLNYKVTYEALLDNDKIQIVRR